MGDKLPVTINNDIFHTEYFPFTNSASHLMLMGLDAITKAHFHAVNRILRRLQVVRLFLLENKIDKFHV